MTASHVPYIPVHCYSQQALFRQSNDSIRGFVGGRGCGKTRIGWMDLAMRAKPGRLYMAISPTYPMLKLTTWRTALEVSRQLGILIPQSINNSDHTLRIRTQEGGPKAEAEVVFRSADDPERLRGPNAMGAWLDEASLMSRDVLPIVMACLRDAGDIGWLSLTFTPRGKRHWTYETFFDAQLDEWHGRVLKPGRFLVQARSRDNPFLHENFDAQNRPLYTSAMASQELEGEFIDVEGLLFRREWFTSSYVSGIPCEATRVRYWDKAFGTGMSHKRTAGVLIAYGQDGLFYVEDCIAEKLSPDARNRMIRTTAENDAKRYGNTVHIAMEQEGGSGGPESAMISARELVAFPFHIDKVAGSGVRMRDREPRPNEGKIVRAAPFAAACENGLVRVVRGGWNADWLEELLMFPDYAYMDRVDATSGSYNRLVAMTTAHLDCVGKDAAAITAERREVQKPDEMEDGARYGVSGRSASGSRIFSGAREAREARIFRRQ